MEAKQSVCERKQLTEEIWMRRGGQWIRWLKPRARTKNRNMLTLVRRTQVTRVKQLLRPVAASFHSTPTACDAAPKDNKIGSQLEVKRTNRRPTNPVVFVIFLLVASSNSSTNTCFTFLLQLSPHRPRQRWYLQRFNRIVFLG